MIYTIEKANLLATQLNRFATSFPHHLAGQFANIDFWMDETAAALKVIDDYNKRFEKLRDAQERWVKNHGTKVQGFCPLCGGTCEFDDGWPTPPVRTSHVDLKAARRNLSDAAYKLLLRCFRAGLLEEERLKAMCIRAGTSVDPSDLRRKQ